MFLVGKIQWDPYESTMKHDFVFSPATDPYADWKFLLEISINEAKRELQVQWKWVKRCNCISLAFQLVSCSARAGRGQVIPLKAAEPTARNIYKDEFCWKPYSKAEPIRSGSASKVRRNNPQPSNRFLIWKLPREEALLTESLAPWTKPVTKQEIEDTLKKQYRTVYAKDYLGIQPGGTRDPAPPDWKTLVPQPPDTESRRSYQPQPMAPDLMDFTRKYGCNAKRHVAVKGAVPSVSLAQIWNYECTRQLSTYQKDFGKDYLDIISVLNTLNPEEIKAYVEKAPHPGK
ncbi:hypothetical protein lerEdw1_012534 [Lerista edwardsae]|nr:hypothetical protein lerEdw1_012534 [Lerista edwardsae]